MSASALQAAHQPNEAVQLALAQFIRALRVADVRISTAEALDAYEVAACIGWRDKSLLKDSLAATLSKTTPEKAIFDTVFERFFQAKLYSEDAGPSDLNPESALGALLMQANQTEIDRQIMQAGRQLQTDQISVFTQKGLYSRRILDAMGQAEVLQEIRAAHSKNQSALAEALTKRLALLRDKTSSYVEKQFLLYADTQGRAVRESLLSTIKLSQIERHHLKSVQQIIQRMAKKLAAQYKARRRRKKIKRLDLPRTLRYNMRFDGILFKLLWRSKKKSLPQIFAICDVSGSVANYSRFMLMFLCALEEVLPKMRAFAFSSRLEEVTDCLADYEPEEAMSKILHRLAGGATDYGQALDDFLRLCLDKVNHLSTIIILGDGRNNYGDPRNELLQTLYRRAGRIIWLNPESPYSWDLGDAEMQKYQPFCHQVMECNSLKHLQKLASRLLRTQAA